MNVDLCCGIGPLGVMAQASAHLAPWISDLMGVSIPIVAILAGCGLALANSIMRHRERMAMIEQGLHPDDRQARDAFRASIKGKPGKTLVAEEPVAGGWTDYVPPKR